MNFGTEIIKNCVLPTMIFKDRHQKKFGRFTLMLLEMANLIPIVAQPH